MPQIHFGLHTREIREDDATTGWPEDSEQGTTAKAADAFRVFLSSLMPRDGNTKGFTVRAYAALWCIDPASFHGMTQKDIAASLGVNHQYFNRLAGQWARQFGFIGGKMRPRVKTIQGARGLAKKNWVKGGA